MESFYGDYSYIMRGHQLYFTLYEMTHFSGDTFVEFPLARYLNVMAKESGSPSLCRMRKAPSLGILIR